MKPPAGLEVALSLRTLDAETSRRGPVCPGTWMHQPAPERKKFCAAIMLSGSLNASDQAVAGIWTGFNATPDPVSIADSEPWRF